LKKNILLPKNTLGHPFYQVTFNTENVTFRLWDWLWQGVSGCRKDLKYLKKKARERAREKLKIFEEEDFQDESDWKNDEGLWCGKTPLKIWP
jgi:hypothetical protein